MVYKQHTMLAFLQLKHLHSTVVIKYSLISSLSLSLTAPCDPLYLTALGLICPRKIGLICPKGRELQAIVIAALSLRVS
jgi:hypothetical protein